MNRDKFRDFSAEAPLGKGEDWGVFGMVWGGEMGQNRMFLALAASFAATFPPSTPPTSPRFLPLSERPTGRIYTKSQVVPFKIKAFSGGIIACTGQEEGAELGRFGGWK